MFTKDQCTECGDFRYWDRKEDIIGKGSTGTIVFRGISMGLVIAIKRINKSHDWKEFIDEIRKTQTADTKFYELRNARRTGNITEVEILREISHQNIIRIYNFKYIEPFIYIPMEMCDESLYQYCERIDDYDIEARINILKQIGEGIKYLHNRKKPIIHRDLKPENILLKSNDSKGLIVKVSDFGISRIIKGDEGKAHHSTEATKGSLYCKPLEVLKDYKRITVAVDIYALGCLVQTLLSKSLEKMHPFGDLGNARNLENNVIEENRIHFLTSKEEETDLFILADLAIDDATNGAYEKRPDICTFTEHPLFWTAKRKGLFLKDINNDYIKNDENQASFLNDFSNVLPLRFDKGIDGFSRWTNNSSEFWKILKRKIQTKRIKDRNYDTTYPTLITFVRNICEHFPEHTKIFEDDADVLKVLGDNKTSFIKNVLNDYPYLIADIFMSFRKALLSGECLNVDYDVYFENLCSKKILCDSITGVAQWLNDGMQNARLSWERVEQLTSPTTPYDVIKYFTENAGTGIHPCVVAEIVLKWWKMRPTTEDVDMSFMKPLIETIKNVSSHWYRSVCEDIGYNDLIETLEIPRDTVKRDIFYSSYYERKSNNQSDLWNCIRKGDGTQAPLQNLNCTNNMERYRQSVPAFSYNAAEFPPYGDTRHHWYIALHYKYKAKVSRFVSLLTNSKEDILNYFRKFKFVLHFVPLPDTLQ